jgi:hypothetical protein
VVFGNAMAAFAAGTDATAGNIAAAATAQTPSGSSNRSRRRIGRCRSARSGCDPRFANAVGARVLRHNPVTEAEQIPWPRYAPDARTKDLQNRAREGPSSRGSALTCQARGLSPPV